MAISTITINTVDYISYASVSEADNFLAVDPVRSTAWAALTADQKGANLVAATRRLDLLAWAGEKTGDEGTQVNAWPRTGVSYADGTAVTTTDVPPEVANATILLAGTIAISATAAQAGSSASNQKVVQAGSARVEFFRPTAGVPLQDETAYGLISQFLDSGTQSGTVGMVTFGGEAADSVFDADDQLGFGLNEGGYP